MVDLADGQREVSDDWDIEEVARFYGGDVEREFFILPLLGPADLNETDDCRGVSNSGCCSFPVRGDGVDGTTKVYVYICPECWRVYDDSPPALTDV